MKTLSTVSMIDLACLAINVCGKGQHPRADATTLPYFKRSYVLDCMKTAIDESSEDEHRDAFSAAREHVMTSYQFR